MLASTLTGACVTGALHDKEFSNYKDTFSSVLISSDAKNLAVITAKYHYVFGAKPQIAGALQGAAHKYITAEIYDFTLGKANSLSGHIRLCIPTTAPSADIQAMLALGFSASAPGKDYCYFTQLTGTRYRAGNVAIGQAYSLNKSYDVNIKVTNNAWEKGLKIAATPITATLDGALIIAGSPLLAIYLVILANSEAPIH